MAPALLIAARAKYLASAAFAQVADAVGTGPAPLTAWVFVDVNPRTGLPDAYGVGKSAVAFYLRPGSWHTNDTSARFPTLAATVFAQGDPAWRDAEWQARAVAESLITCFDDFSNTQPKQWTPNLYVVRSRWSGELAVYEAENLEGMYRAELSFEIETA